MGWETVWGTLLGALLSIAITVFFETLRKPSLTMELRNDKPADFSDVEKPADKGKWLYAELRNNALPPIWKFFVSRNAALQCHGLISFHHLDGTNVFGRPMTARWRVSPLPAATEFALKDGNLYPQINYQYYEISNRPDIFPGEIEPSSINIASRFDEEEECYGWTNESFAKNWRHPLWKLPNGRYLVHVVIISAGEKIEKNFRLINDVTLDDFRLEPALPGDKVIP